MKIAIVGTGVSGLVAAHHLHRQHVREGVLHNYLRMLWGKKIQEWTRSPQRALEIMLELNNKYPLDGRNPNSYSGSSGRWAATTTFGAQSDRCLARCAT